MDINNYSIKLFMSPFAHYLHKLRMTRKIRQTDLAEMTGYEQSYVSALEVGLKSPPTEEFVTKLIVVLKMTPEQAQEAREEAAASQRKFILEADTHQDIYRMMNCLRACVDRLHPKQIKTICDVLEMSEEMPPRQPEPLRRLPRRKPSEEATM